MGSRISKRFFHRGASAWSAIAIAFAITVCHISLAAIMADRPTLSETYQSFYQFDAHWYADIVERGYHSLVPPGVQGQGIKMEDSNVINRLLVPLMSLLFLIRLCAERLFFAREPHGWRMRVGLYMCALFIWFIALSGTPPALMSMNRYALAPFLLLLLALLRMAPLSPSFVRRRWLAGIIFSYVFLYFLSFQMLFLYRFTHGLWVA
jgi:hypothetical protein